MPPASWIPQRPATAPPEVTANRSLLGTQEPDRPARSAGDWLRRQKRFRVRKNRTKACRVLTETRRRPAREVRPRRGKPGPPTDPTTTQSPAYRGRAGSFLRAHEGEDSRASRAGWQGGQRVCRQPPLVSVRVRSAGRPDHYDTTTSKVPGTYLVLLWGRRAPGNGRRTERRESTQQLGKVQVASGPALRALRGLPAAHRPLPVPVPPRGPAVPTGRRASEGGSAETHTTPARLWVPTPSTVTRHCSDGPG